MIGIISGVLVFLAACVSIAAIYANGRKSAIIDEMEGDLDDIHKANAARVLMHDHVALKRLHEKYKR